MYFITCFEKTAYDHLGWPDMGSTRTFGFFSNKEEAFKALHLNYCDMWEYLYNYAVVEEIDYGIHPPVLSRQFFKYDNKRNGFFEIDEPKEFKNCTNITLG